MAILPVDSTLTSGVGTFTATLLTAGSQTITATDTVVPVTTGTSNAILVAPGAATHFLVIAPATASAGTSFGFSVTALDQSGNTATGYTGTVHFTSSDSAATLPADATLTTGVGAFTATLRTAGLRTMTATDTQASSITGTSTTIVVSPVAATHLVFTVPLTATAGVPFSLTLTAQDPFGNTATGYTGIVHFTSSDGAATLPADSALPGGSASFTSTLRTPGARTLTATDIGNPAINGVSAPITVILSPSPSPVNGGFDNNPDSPETGFDNNPVNNTLNLTTTTLTVNIGGDSSFRRATVTGKGVSGLIVTAMRTAVPSTVPVPEGGVYEYADIVPARYVSISGVAIEFDIPRTWLESRNAGPDSIVLQRFNSTKWETLPTNVTGNSSGFVSYRANSPGFSLFAISIGKSPAATGLSSTVPATQAQGTAGEGIRATTPPLAATSPVPAQTGQPSPVLPLTTIGLIGAILVVIFGVAIIARRWWIRRQNPALFKKD